MVFVWTFSVGSVATAEMLLGCVDTSERMPLREPSGRTVQTKPHDTWQKKKRQGQQGSRERRATRRDDVPTTRVPSLMRRPRSGADGDPLAFRLAAVGSSAGQSHGESASVLEVSVRAFFLGVVSSSRGRPLRPASRFFELLCFLSHC